MTRYLLVSRSAEYESRLRRLLGSRLQTVPGEYLAFGTTEVVGQVAGDPAVALLGPLLSFDESRSIASTLRESHPGLGVIVVREQRSDLEDWVDAMDIQAVLSPEASDSTTIDLLGRLDAWLVGAGRAEPYAGDLDEPNPADDTAVAFVELLTADRPLEFAEDADTDSGNEPAVEEWVLPPVDPGVRSEVIAVAAPKGGQGKTTMAVNLAVGLAEVAPNSVVLIDADLQFGDVANVLDLHPTRDLADFVRAADDEVLIKTQLIRHSDDFFVVPAPLSPEFADDIDAASLGRLIDRLASMFRYVVIDTTPGLGDHTISALEHATDGVFVTSLTVASLRAMRTEFQLLTELGLIPRNRHIVLNHVEKNTGLVPADATAIVGAEADIVVPRSPGVLLAGNAGVPLIHHDPRDNAAKAVRALVQRVDPAAVPTRRRIHRKARNDELE